MRWPEGRTLCLGIWINRADKRAFDKHVAQWRKRTHTLNGWNFAYSVLIGLKTASHFGSGDFRKDECRTDLYQHLLRLRRSNSSETFSTGHFGEITVVTDQRSTPRAVLAPDQGSSKLERITFQENRYNNAPKTVCSNYALAIALGVLGSVSATFQNKFSSALRIARRRTKSVFSKRPWEEGKET